MPLLFTYLAHESRHEFDNIFVVPELPNNHHDLFHGNFVRQILAQNFIDEFFHKGIVFLLLGVAHWSIIICHFVILLFKEKTSLLLVLVGSWCWCWWWICEIVFLGVGFSSLND